MLVEQLPDLNLNLYDMRDSTTISIVDASSYPFTPTTSNVALQVTPPGYPTVNIPFVPLNVNVYKAVDLGIVCGDTTCTPVPDGIYDVVYTVTSIINPKATETYTEDFKFIKIDQIKCKYQHMFLRLDLECCNSDKLLEKRLAMVKLLIDGSVAECNAENYKSSWEMYHKAEHLLNQMSKRFGGGETCFGKHYGSFIGCCSTC